MRRADARRNIEAIVEAAARTLSENPRAVMQQIAEEAGLHRATVHRHFASRDDLIVAVRRRSLDALGQQLTEVLSGPERPSGEMLDLVVRTMLEVGDRYRVYQYTTWHDATIEERRGELSEPVFRLLTTAQKDGQVRGDVSVEMLAAALGGLIWAVLPHIARGTMTTDEAVAFVRVMLGAPAA